MQPPKIIEIETASTKVEIITGSSTVELFSNNEKVVEVVQAGSRGPKGDPGNDGADGGQGEQGNPGTPGENGIDGWTPILAIQSDGARRVQQIVDWTGGEGTKPATGSYIGIGGLVSNIADGVDIRGPAGAAGEPGGDGAPGAPGADGDDGSPGAGIAVGGSAGQILSKVDGTDYNTTWIDKPTGDVTSAGSITDNRMVRGDGGGKGVQETGIAIDDSNNITGVGTLSSAAQTITSTSANALAVGPSGTTDPAVRVSPNALYNSGLEIVPVGNSQVNINAIGNGVGEVKIRLATKNNARLNISSNNLNLNDDRFTTNFSGSGSGGVVWNFSYGGNSGSNATANDPIMEILGGSTRTSGTGTRPVQQNVLFKRVTLAASGASVTGLGASVAIEGPPQGGSNITITHSTALHIQTAAQSNTTNAWGVYVEAPTGAANNYAGFFGGNIVVGSTPSTPDGQIECGAIISRGVAVPKLSVGTTAPPTPSVGDLWVDTN